MTSTEKLFKYSTNLNQITQAKKTMKILYFWPYGELNEIEFYKDPGEIPAHLAKLGYETILVIGKLALTDVCRGAERMKYLLVNSETPL